MAATLELSQENVEKVLDELRPYLMADGGNVELVEIEGRGTAALTGCLWCLSQFDDDTAHGY